MQVRPLMSWRHRMRNRDRHAFEWALDFIDYLVGVLEAAGVEFVHASVFINEQEHHTMIVGTTATATVTYADSNGAAVDPPAGTTHAFDTSDGAVATVDAESGAVTAVAAGTATIGCTSTFPDGVTQTAAQASVTVEAANPASSAVTVA